MRVVEIHTPSRRYELHVGEGVLSTIGCCLMERSAAVIVTDDRVARLHLGTAAEACSNGGVPVHHCVLPAGEEHKTLVQAGEVFDRLGRLGIDRQGLIVALGGGMVGDLAGFVASTWLRGVGLINCPTTLLAAVDAAVGGKTGLNHAGLKNRIGTYHQPERVCVDTRLLQTLDARQWSSGLGECIKHALVARPAFVEWLGGALNAVQAREHSTISELVARSVAVKAEVVSQDEQERTGLREKLNFGHTLGHAIEAASDYRLSHGECVSLGMMAAFVMARALGRVGTAELTRLEGLLSRCGLPIRTPPDLSRDRVLAALAADKKARAGRTRFVLPDAGGGVSTGHEVERAVVEQALDYLAE
jgi:3-dehydroquinate synthase